MYQLTHALDKVHGIGDSWTTVLAKKNINSILDFLLYLPIRYEDRSQIFSIAQLKRLHNSVLIDGVNPELKNEFKKKQNHQQQTSKFAKKERNYQAKQEFFTLVVKVKDYRQYYKGRLLIARATLVDQSGELPAIWFNNKFLKNKINAQQQYYASGQWKNGSLLQANLEAITTDSPHTARLVPIYSQVTPFKQGSLRRLQKEIIDHLNPQEQLLAKQLTSSNSTSQVFSNVQEFFQALHFPQSSQDIIQAREQLALEEIIFLINKAKKLKKSWQENHTAPQIAINAQELIPSTLPFALTKAQQTAIKEISADLQKSTAMNRLLIGDVGSGKTAVAAIAAWHCCLAGHNAALIAPTQILAQQHLQSIKNLLPEQKVQLVTAQTSKNFKLDSATLYIGTHALINKLEIIKPALIIYDEQHRFGTKQRQSHQAHLLTMSATPIPRSLMLTIFAHLQSSILDEMPSNRVIAKSWLVPQVKEEAAIMWLAEQLLSSKDKQAFIVCPFIDPSQHAALENVAAVKNSLEQLEIILNKYYQQQGLAKNQHLKVAILHSRLKKQEQQAIIDRLYQKDIQILVSTPMIEVGIDLPNADLIIIQAAERFGLASLHQLRGRVGRAGQESYCLLFSTQQTKPATNNLLNRQESHKRLQIFAQEKDGFKLAQLDLQHRGAGDIFGSAQSGFNKLQFASWTNLKIIQEAKKISEEQLDYQSLLTAYFEKQDFLNTINNN